MISLVPMAGRGSRFSREGYRLPKPLIPVMGLPMFIAALKSFPRADKVIFICQQKFLERYPLAAEIDKHLASARIIPIPQVTEGQACTCLLAQDLLPPEEELLISSIDYQVVYDRARFVELRANPAIDVAVFTFQTGAISKKDPTAFAYCRVAGSRVLEVVEKRTISPSPESDPAVVGIFYFRRAGDFVRGARRMIRKNIRVNQEFYVGTSINQLIEEGLRVHIFPVEKFISFGDPFELRLYEYWEDFFYHEEKHPYKGLR